MGDIATKWSYDAGEDTIILDRVQDVEPHLDFNKFLQTLQQKSDWGRHTGHIPCVFLEQWLNEEWERGNTQLRPFTPEFDAIIHRKLEDPDWKFLRVDCANSWLGFGS